MLKLTAREKLEQDQFVEKEKTTQAIERIISFLSHSHPHTSSRKELIRVLHNEIRNLELQISIDKKL